MMSAPKNNDTLRAYREKRNFERTSEKPMCPIRSRLKCSRLNQSGDKEPVVDQIHAGTDQKQSPEPVHEP